jgi:tetratricopeptide (TPR) repeat protein
MSATYVGNAARLTARLCTGLTGLAMLVSVLIGCATDGKISPNAVADNRTDVEGTSVMRLEDGREGFLISEVPQMDEASRRDFERAVALLNEQDYDMAIELLAKIIEQSPGVTAPYINIAMAYRHVGQPEKAEEHLKTALTLIPGHPVASNEYGLLFRKRGRFDEARALYEKALTMFPDYYPVHRNLGILCDLYMNDLDCALEHYEIYSHAKPEDRQITLWITDLRARLGRD